MKFVFLLAAFICSLSAYSQDTLMKMKQIDSLVDLIKTSGFTGRTDTIKEDQPQFGYFLTIYETAVVDKNELKKYVDELYVTRTENGTTNKLHSRTSLFYHHSKLIKVEESGIDGTKDFSFLWYYADDKPLYHSSTESNAEERANALLQIAKLRLNKVNGNPNEMFRLPY
jgi:hypothetical protein